MIIRYPWWRWCWTSEDDVIVMKDRAGTDWYYQPQRFSQVLLVSHFDKSQMRLWNVTADCWDWFSYGNRLVISVQKHFSSNPPRCCCFSLFVFLYRFESQDQKSSAKLHEEFIYFFMATSKRHIKYVVAGEFTANTLAGWDVWLFHSVSGFFLMFQDAVVYSPPGILSQERNFSE